jgi:hypothetical protein
VSTISAELQALIDAGVITPDQAEMARAAAPDPNVVSGFATCMDKGCDEWEVDRPIRLTRSTVRTWAIDLPLVLAETHYLAPVDDADIVCPGCGGSCAIKSGKAPVYQKLV